MERTKSEWLDLLKSINEWEIENEALLDGGTLIGPDHNGAVLYAQSLQQQRQSVLRELEKFKEE